MQPLHSELINESDEILIDMAGLGDERAIAVLMRRYCPLVFALIPPCANRLRDEAIFVGLETMYGIVRNFDHNSETTLAETIVGEVSKKLTVWRDESSEREKNILNELDKIDFGKEELLRALETMCGAKSDNLIKTEDYDELLELPEYLRQRVWESFSPLEREVFTLYGRGQSYGEISKNLNRSVKSIDNALYRIKRKVENILRQD